MKVELLTYYTLEKDTVIMFLNKDKLALKAGLYYTCAFGVVIDLTLHTCIASEKARWKIM